MPWRTIFKWSKNIHKYTGLICLLYFLSAGVSGVLLNHPSLIRKVTMSASCTPPSFRFENWNRMAMREAVFYGTDSKSVIVGGRAGVWRSSDGGRTFSPMDEGYPASAFERDALCLLLCESDGARSLYAGTRNGLYRFEFETKHWDRIEDVRLENTEVVDLVSREESVLVFTPEACYRLEGEKQEDPVLRLMPLVAGTSEDTRAPMTRFMQLQYWADYEQGLLPLNSGTVLPEMPEKIGRGPHLSLWHFMFALHNGRLFQDWLGGYTWLFVPLGGFLLLTGLFSGTYDWLYRKGVFRRGRLRR